MTNNKKNKDLLRALFPSINQSELIREILDKSQLLDLPPEAQILGVGSPIQLVPLVLSGLVKVTRVDENGNEIFMYYIQSGESCAMTLSSCIKREKSGVQATTQQPTQILGLPVNLVNRLMINFPSWNAFMLETFSQRFDEVLQLVDDIAFQSLDSRLSRLLFKRAMILQTNSFQVSKTAIAKDLNSSREVISRLLKKMHEQGLIQMEKNQIHLTQHSGKVSDFE